MSEVPTITSEFITTVLMYADFLWMILWAFIFGSVFGLEREFKGKPAGLKTHVLICVGAASITYVSAHFSLYGDPTRIAAQIVSGIGFIGAGAIMQSKRIIQGLTTASTIWVVAAVGMLTGTHMIVHAGIVTVLVLTFLITSRHVSRAQSVVSPYCVSLHLTKISALEKIEELLGTFNILTTHKSLVKHDDIYLELAYKTSPLNQHLFIRRLLQIKGIGRVSKI